VAHCVKKSQGRHDSVEVSKRHRSCGQDEREVATVVGRLGKEAMVSRPCTGEELGWGRLHGGEKGRDGNGGLARPNQVRKVKMAQGQFWV
jgi:hypothetical protein